jgi:hypothetical protein
MHLILRRDYDAAVLVREHPPQLTHPHKQLVYALCGGAETTGPIALTRWYAERLPDTRALAPTEVVLMPGHYDYAGEQRAVWHVNFADPVLFVAYGSALLAQDELQCAEHPALGSVREALLAENALALTEQDGIATPVLVAGVERRCTIETAPCDARPFGLYGNRFAMSPPDVVRGAVRVHRPPARSNLIAMAAPTGWGDYTRPQLEQIVTTAYTGFAAAIAESERLWPGAPVEVRTGFWGCGAFGGNRHVMTMLQIFAARLAGVARLRFYVFDDAGRATFDAAAATLERVLGGTIADVIERVADLDYAWGVSDGN